MNMFLSFLSSLRWQDIADILLNSYILFRLYVLFRGTHVFRVITVIAFLWIVQQIALFFGLVLTSWAMQGLSAVAALIIIIVFRNEIRSVLQAKNLKTVLWGLSHNAVRSPTDVIVNSVKELSRKQIGALIVFPAKDDLFDTVQSGISWNGTISKEMIISIFWPENPVHDGAVIIEGNKISRAGVILPLSHRTDLPSKYGTRHRAALGLVESSDAMVLVVSEETGNISIAKDSELKEIVNDVQLVRMLNEHVGISVKENDYYKKEKRELAVAALLSILFITGVWFSFSRGSDTLITQDISVEYTKPDTGMEIIDTSANSIHLSLGGSGALIKSLQPEQIRIRINLDNAVVGNNTFTITRENITLPPGIHLKKITPGVVTVTLDDIIMKKFPVQVDWVGKLKANTLISRVVLDPAEIEVTGGSRILNKITTIYTEKVHLENLKQSGEMIVNPALTPASLKTTPRSQDRVKIYYILTPSN